MAAWLPQPVAFDSSHELTCNEGLTPEECAYYADPWRNWYVADWSYSLPTVALFMCTIGFFVIGYFSTRLVLASSGREPMIWRRGTALTRYLSYRGYRIESIGWNSAPLGLLLLAAVGTIYFFCMDLAPSPYYWPGPSDIWGGSPPLGTRSGWLALACMPFIFATATKTNWVTLVTGVTHEKLQVFHRWIAYAFFVLALMHTFPFIVWHIRNHDMVMQFTMMNVFEYWTGVVALLVQAWLTFASWGPFRLLGYETFKIAHFSAVIVFMIVFFWHCDGTLTSWHYFVATAAIYVPCWTYAWVKTLFEHGRKKASISVESNGFINVSMPADFDWVPGQHCFLRFTSLGLGCLSSHPFTICSLPSSDAKKPSELSFYIRAQRGLTARLHSLAASQPGTQIPVLIEGPYGGIDSLNFFGQKHLVVIAGGSGSGWTLPLIEQFLRHYTRQSKSSTQSGPQTLLVILATRDPTSRAWYHSAVRQLLSAYEKDIVAAVTVHVHVTGEAQQVSKFEPSSSDTEHSIASNEKAPAMNDAEELQGRPNLPALIRNERLAHQGERIGVYVCGPTGMQHDVRNEVAQQNLTVAKQPELGSMYLHLEHFSWA